MDPHSNPPSSSRGPIERLLDPESFRVWCDLVRTTGARVGFGDFFLSYPASALDR